MGNDRMEGSAPDYGYGSWLVSARLFQQRCDIDL